MRPASPLKTLAASLAFGALVGAGVIVGVAAFARPASAQTSVQDWIRVCDSPSDALQTACAMYAAGLRDAFDLVTHRGMFACVPEWVSNNAVNETVLSVLREMAKKPKGADLSFRAAMRTAMVMAYPCQSPATR